MTPGWASRIRFGLPLLAKDLTELAARRRTYVVRSVYAALLFISFAIFFYGTVAGRRDVFLVLGAGRAMSQFLIIVQLTGIYLFLPAMVSGAITEEKEKRTLELLFATDLGPWEILLQKYIGRIIPMFTFLLLSLPLLAVAYSFGGVDTGWFAVAVYVLFTTCMQVAAFALMWSTICRTSSEAIGGTYGAGILIFMTVGILSLLLAQPIYLGNSYAFSPLISVFPPMLLIGVPFGGLPAGAAAMPWAWTALFLLGARFFLVRRAHVPAKKRRGLFRRLNDWMAAARSTTRGRGRSRHAGDFPGDRPIAWREVGKTSLGSVNGFVVTGLVLGLPVLIAAWILSSWIGQSPPSIGVTLVVFALWVGAALSITVKSASAFTLERTNGTLELLLTTPLTGREIVSQKAAAVRRRILLMTLLLGVLFVWEVVLESATPPRRSYSHGYYGSGRNLDFGPLGYLMIAFLSVPVYLSAAGWVATWLGLRSRKRSRATMLSLGVVFSWCVGPFILAAVIMSLSGSYREPVWLFAFSPATIVVLTELANYDNTFHELFGTGAGLPIALSFALYGGTALVFRSLCLTNADRYLGRPAATGAPARAPAPAVTVGGGAA